MAEIGGIRDMLDSLTNDLVATDSLAVAMSKYHNSSKDIPERQA